jgi:hypothetical protein
MLLFPFHYSLCLRRSQSSAYCLDANTTNISSEDELLGAMRLDSGNVTPSVPSPVPVVTSPIQVSKYGESGCQDDVGHAALKPIPKVVTYITTVSTQEMEYCFGMPSNTTAAT